MNTLESPSDVQAPVKARSPKKFPGMNLGFLIETMQLEESRPEPGYVRVNPCPSRMLKNDGAHHEMLRRGPFGSQVATLVHVDDEHIPSYPNRPFKIHRVCYPGQVGFPLPPAGQPASHLAG